MGGRKNLIGILQNLDSAILLAIQEVRSSTLDPLMQAYTSLGNAGMVWIVLSAGMLCFKPTRKAGVLALVAMLLGLVCTNLILKPLVARDRPWLDVAGLIPLIEEPDPHSFPSGHTCAAFATAMIFWRALPETWIGTKALVMCMAFLMGLSRLYVGVHYPSDVLAGALVGSSCAWTVWRIYLLRWGPVSV
ncbi:phosphatase PAP2 family protein [Flavonifractor sp. An100]|nr:phosphatase PAP2 family protein [Flavonifractor sp. An100]